MKTLIRGGDLRGGASLTVSEIKGSVLSDYPVTGRYVQLLLAELRQDYSERGSELKEVASGWRFQARQEYAEELSRPVEQAGSRYSRARDGDADADCLSSAHHPGGDRSHPRGGGVEPDRQHPQGAWLGAQHRPLGGGRSPELLATTREFLDYFSLQSLEQLPELDPELQAPCRSCRARAVTVSLWQAVLSMNMVGRPTGPSHTSMLSAMSAGSDPAIGGLMVKSCKSIGRAGQGLTS